jgi:hypothetical protein
MMMLLLLLMLGVVVLGVRVDRYVSIRDPLVVEDVVRVLHTNQTLSHSITRIHIPFPAAATLKLDPFRGMELPASSKPHVLLVNTPVPDMSMTFNVIAFSSTLFAFLFGGLYNILNTSTLRIIARRTKTKLE